MEHSSGTRRVRPSEDHERPERSAAAPAPPLAARVLQFQRGAGNAAVTRLLARYEGGEHAQMGSATRGMKVNGVELTESDLVAMGDLYKDPAAMQKADPAELTRLRDLVRRDKEHFEGKAGVKAVSNTEWEAATKGRPAGERYMDLAKANDTHFAPLASGAASTKGDHKSEFRKHHLNALGKVLEASKARGGPGGVPDEAKLINGFGTHFLTDAFSAGHLVNKDDAMTQAKTAWSKQTFTGSFFKESAFTKSVASKILADKAAGAKLATKELDMVKWGDVTPTRFSEFIYQMSAKKPDLFFNAFARLVHDKLNESIKDKATALEVENKRGDTWTLAGDDTLAASPETLRIARQAVDQCHLNLVDFAQDVTLSLPGLVDKVWDYTPRPTAKGANTLKDAVDIYTDPQKTKTVDAFAELAIAQIDTLIEQLTNEGYMRDKKP